MLNSFLEQVMNFFRLRSWAITSQMQMRTKWILYVCCFLKDTSLNIFINDVHMKHIFAGLVHSWDRHVIKHNWVGHSRTLTTSQDPSPSPARTGLSSRRRSPSNWSRLAPTYLPPSRHKGDLPAPPIHSTLSPSDGLWELRNQRLPHSERLHPSCQRVGHSPWPKLMGRPIKVSAGEVPTGKRKSPSRYKGKWFWSHPVWGRTEDLRRDEPGFEDGPPSNSNPGSRVRLEPTGGPDGREVKHGWSIWSHFTTSSTFNGAPKTKASASCLLNIDVNIVH